MTETLQQTADRLYAEAKRRNTPAAWAEFDSAREALEASDA